MNKPKNGKSYLKNGWLYISVYGDPKERGYAYGYFIADEFKKIQNMLKFTCMEEMGQEWEYFINASKILLKETIQNNFKEIYDEMEGVSEGINSAGGNTSLDEIIAWNNYFLLTGDWYSGNSSHNHEGGTFKKKQQESCSAFICTGKYSKNGTFVSGHNNFSDFTIGQFGKQVLDITPTNGCRMLIQGFIGWCWSGTDFFITKNGIFGTETTLGGFTKFENNFPLSCRIRKAMQYGKNLDDYIEILLDGNSGDYANSWLFADINKNEIMRFELGLKYHNIERKTDGFFISHNVAYDPKIRNLECVDTGFNDIRRHNGSRKVRLTQLMEKYKGQIDLEIGKTIISDHYDVYLEKDNPCSRTVCSHYDEDGREFMSDPSRPLPYQPRGAVDGNLIDCDLAKNMSFLLKFGRSCDTPFDKEIFFKEHTQWIQYEPYLENRKTQPWTYFKITKRDYKQNLTKKIKKINN
jgi:hypothetical protein